jgi:hypothetical protein
MLPKLESVMDCSGLHVGSRVHCVVDPHVVVRVWHRNQRWPKRKTLVVGKESCRGIEGCKQGILMIYDGNV